MILVTKTSDRTRVCVCVCGVFIKLHITTQSGPFILVTKINVTRIGPPKGEATILVVTKPSDQTRRRGHVLSTVIVCVRVRPDETPLKMTLRA